MKLQEQSLTKKMKLPLQRKRLTETQRRCQKSVGSQKIRKYYYSDGDTHVYKSINIET